jgi:hypothetical protein
MIDTIKDGEPIVIGKAKLVKESDGTPVTMGMEFEHAELIWTIVGAKYPEGPSSGKIYVRPVRSTFVREFYPRVCGFKFVITE